jgi:ABC-type sugar transport system permease subunit
MNIRQRNKFGYLFIAPFFLTFAVFTVYPIIYSLYLSFHSLEPLSGVTTPVGLENYRRLFTSAYFYQSIGNTLLVWVISIVPQLILALVLALILVAPWVKGRNTLRSIYYFPNLVTPVTIGVLFAMLFSSPGGAVNNLLRLLHLTRVPVDFGESPALSRLVVGLAICWQNFGYNVIFFTAGLNSIPRSVIEAAEIDGANAWQRTRRITLPIMRPILVYVMITSVIGGLQMFDITKVLFVGVSGESTKTMVQYLYESAFEHWQLGYGAAVSYGIFLIIAAVSLLSFGAITGQGRLARRGTS